MEREENVAVLLTQDQEGKISKRGITQEQLGEIFFGEGDRKWDQVHMALPDPVPGLPVGLTPIFRAPYSADLAAPFPSQKRG